MSKDLEEYDTCIARPINPTSWILTRDIDYNNLNCWGWWPEVERMRRKKQMPATIDSLNKKPPSKKTQLLVQNLPSNIINKARPNITLRRQKTLQQPQQKHQYFKK